MLTCDEYLLPVYYTDIARGGPSYSTARQGTRHGLESRDINRYDFISKYQIDFSLLPDEQRDWLRTFHILRFGAAYCFRFLAPDKNRLKMEPVTDGVYNPAAVDAGTADYYLIQTYKDAFRSYVRRIVKPAWDDVTLYVGGEPVPMFGDPSSGANLYGSSLYGASYGASACPGEITLDWTTGKIHFDAAALAWGAGKALVADGGFHLPAYFEDDDNQTGIEAPGLGSAWTGLKITEVLPIALGILQ